MFHEKTKTLFSSAVADVASSISRFAPNPGRDLTRKRKLPADRPITFPVSEGSPSTKNEPPDFFGMAGAYSVHFGPMAREAFRRQGLEGFALVSLYGPVLEAMGDAMPLDQALILAWVNADYLDELLQTHRPETVAGHLRHVAAAGLVEAVGGSTQALRLVVEQG